MLVSLLAILIFVSVLLDRLLYYREWAEKAAMEATARQLESVVRIRAAELMLTNRAGELAALERIDPFSLFEVPPGSYAGATDGMDPGAATGFWWFDRRHAVTYYLPNSRRYLTLEPKGEAGGGAIRYRVRLERGPEGRVVGVRLERLTDYRWFE